MSPKAIQERARFDAIRYANCWEDPTMLLRAADLRDKRCLSIASGGDNSFSLLTASPREVVAFDLSPVQLAVCELKAAAFRNLEYGEFLSFLGFAPSARDRADIYRDRSQPRPHPGRRYPRREIRAVFPHLPPVRPAVRAFEADRGGAPA